MPEPLFSIIVPHFQGTVPHDIFLRGIESIDRQTFKNFELLVYHDGPLLEPGQKFPVPVIATEKRFNDYGHSLRDLGIRRARGRYLLHFNPDNVLYDFALQTLADEIARPSRLVDTMGKPLDTDEIIIFPIKMMGLQKFRHMTFQMKDGQPFFIIMTGHPPTVQNIDCMQLVMKRALWLAEGGWYDKRVMGDGFMYQTFTQKYGYRNVGPVLGEHH